MPTGLLGSSRLAREVRMRWLMASKAWSWPMTRRPRCCSSLSTVATSSFTILPTGMPVQPEMTSPTICASTQTRISGILALQVIERGVHLAQLGAQLGAVVERLVCAVARRVLLFELGADFANLVHQLQFFVPALLQLGFSSVFGGRARFGDIGQALGMVGAHGRFAFEHARLHGQIVQGAGGVFDGRRDGVLAQRQPGASGIQDADGFIGQAGGPADSDARA